MLPSFVFREMGETLFHGHATAGEKPDLKSGLVENTKMRYRWTSTARSAPLIMELTRILQCCNVDEQSSTMCTMLYNVYKVIQSVQSYTMYTKLYNVYIDKQCVQSYTISTKLYNVFKVIQCVKRYTLCTKLLQCIQYFQSYTMCTKLLWCCSETTITRESRFCISTRVLHAGKQTGSPLDQWDMVQMQGDCRLSTGLPSSRWLCQL